MIALSKVINPKTIVDKSTFEKPHQYSEGIDFVIINGKIAIDKGTFKGLKAGYVLKKNQ